VKIGLMRRAKAMGRRKCAGVRELIEQTRGGVLALVALFLPIAVLCVGLVMDLGTVFFVRKAVQPACDLGVLAGVQELQRYPRPP